MRPISSNVSFKTCVSLLIFCFDDLSIGVSGVLKNLLPLLCYCQFILLCLLVFDLCIKVLLLGAWIFTIVMSSSWIHPLIIMYCSSLSLVIFFTLRSILSDMRIATPAFFCFPFAWNIFFHPLTFSLYVFLGLKWVSCKQRIYGSCFCIHSASLCLLVGVF